MNRYLNVLRSGMVHASALLILMLTSPSGLKGQVDPLDAYHRYRRVVRPGILWSEIGLSTVYDTNIELNQAHIEGPGLVGDLHVQLRTSTRLPLLRIDYFGSVQQFRASESWNRYTHSVLGALEKRLGPVAIEAIGSWYAGGQTEDREIADAYLVSPRISLRLGGVRVRAYGRHWSRDFQQDGRTETIETFGGDFRLRAFDRMEFEVGYRHETGDSDMARSRFIRETVLGRWRISLTARTALVFQTYRRERSYPERLVEVEGREVLTRDLRWLPTVYFTQGRMPGPELRIAYEYQTRTSNDFRRVYDGHRTTLSFRVPLIGWVGEPDSGS